MVDLSALLSKKSDEIAPPAQLPIGQYLFRVKGVKTDRKSSTGNPFVDFDVDAVQPLEVEDEQVKSIEFPYSLRHSYVVTEKSLFRLRDFLTNALAIEGDGRALGEVLSEAPGHVFRGNISHRPNPQDATRFFVEIAETFSAE
jgi:hypothetical protein